MHNYSTYRAAQLVGKIKFDKKSCTFHRNGNTHLYFIL
uniref:Uncharacterized protein n=1 Tax=Rhizophora mucronata TaxID=61149 RepID=A0A2P2MNH6_RHIMU